MKKGLLTSIICFSSLVFSSCGSKYVKVTILECEHCSFENVGKTRVGQDLVLKTYLDKGYLLDRDRELIQITAGGTGLGEYAFTYSNNQLTIDKQYVSFGDITIKGKAYARENTITYHLKGTRTYSGISEGSSDIRTIENDYEKTVTIASGDPITKEDISIAPNDINFDYIDGKLKIEIGVIYTDIKITLP